MLEKLKGFRTYIVAFLGLFVVPLGELLMNVDAGKKAAAFLKMKFCTLPYSVECMQFVNQIEQGVDTMYLAIVGGLIAYFRSQGKKTPPTL